MQQVRKSNRYEIDMTEGKFFTKIFKFCFPLMLTGILQLLYNAADLIVVGKFGHTDGAVGAVGSTSALINLIVNLFMGLSVGANVLSARRFASKDHEGLSRVVHTAITISFISGIGLGIIGFVFARQFLELMNNYRSLAVVYLKIYFLGMPFNMLYNFAASILRGVGDTKRPLYFLAISGLVNVVLNIFFIVVFHMDVNGVAIATVISQIIACVLIMICLFRTKEAYGFSFRKIHIYKKELVEITKIGLPAGIQGSIFSISNVIIQTSINGFDKLFPYVVDGNSVGQSIEGFVYTAMTSVYHAALAFTGQNIGVGKLKNVKKVTYTCLIIVTLIGVVMGGVFFLLGKQLSAIYTSDPNQIEISYLRLHYLCLPYFLDGIMEVMVGVLRGMGYSIMPMIVSILGICGFRIVWIYGVFYPMTDFTRWQDLHYLYISYPISWIITFIIHFITYKVVYRREAKSKMTIA